MKHFIELFEKIENTTKNSLKEQALIEYFQKAPAEDAAWALMFLMGKRIQKIIPIKVMKEVTQELANIPDWLFQECYHRVGDLSETISLLISQSDPKPFTGSLSEFVKNHVLLLKQANNKNELLKKSYLNLSKTEIFILNKFITGQFRLGVAKGLIIKSLSKYSGLNEAIIGQRLLGNWEPKAIFFENLVRQANREEQKALRIKPFMLAQPLPNNINELENLNDWQIEWKWDGIRAQLVIDNDKVQIWSRGEELINETFPEIVDSAAKLKKKMILDGEILAFKQQVLSFQYLQKRLNRKNVTKKILIDFPCIFYSFDILHLNHQDLRYQPLETRRKILETVLPDNDVIKLCQIIASDNLKDILKLHQKSRQFKAEGFMLKHKNSPYVMGRKTGLWWKWKISPMTIDAVLVQAQRGHGRRAGIFSDYTFALWKNDQLVTFAKAYSGLNDDEMMQINQFIKKNTTDKFGPVVAVKPELVFEIAFENIQVSKRHKSGVAVRFPRIIRARPDKKVHQANTVDDLLELLKLYE